MFYPGSEVVRVRSACRRRTGRQEMEEDKPVVVMMQMMIMSGETKKLVLTNGMQRHTEMGRKKRGPLAANQFVRRWAR